MHGDHDRAPAPGGLDGGELSAALARRPQWPEHGVRRAGDLVFVQADLGHEDAGREVGALAAGLAPLKSSGLFLLSMLTQPPSASAAYRRKGNMWLE